jgi:hypothetical protein
MIRTAKDLANSSDHRYTTAATDGSNNKSNILHSATASPVLGDTAKMPLVRPGHVAIVSRPPLVRSSSSRAMTARPPSVQLVTAAVVKRVYGLTPLVTAGHVVTASSGEVRMSVLKPPAAR